jgi:mannose/cellobiose epimerase-like protein (N-acyl-D-glucosamine 2-epimerase family)
MPYWDSLKPWVSLMGNYPTHRARDGRLVEETRRWPRMMGRQIFTYSVAFMLTGEPSTWFTPRPGLTGW